MKSQIQIAKPKAKINRKEMIESRTYEFDRHYRLFNPTPCPEQKSSKSILRSGCESLC